MVGMKSMLSSPFVSSQRPNTELAAASTEQREFRVVVMPAWGEFVCPVNFSEQQESCVFVKILKWEIPWRWRWSVAPWLHEWPLGHPLSSEQQREVFNLGTQIKLKHKNSCYAKNPFTLSNSSMHTTPPSASTMAPPSMMNPRVLGSLNTEAVRPAALLPLPDV